MMRTLLVRGLIAGLIAGIAAAVFAYLVGEPPVDAAIALEEAAAAHESHGAVASDSQEMVSRDVQSTIGLLVATSAIGIALGGLFSLAFAFVYGRLGGASPRSYAALLGAGAFVAVSLVPFLKYPGNPPAVGQLGTIVDRTELHFAFLGISVIAAGLAVYGARILAEKTGGWTAAVISGAGYLAVMAAVGALMPVVDEVPAEFPATVLWDFRVASLGTLLVLWGVLGVAFGALAQPVLRRSERRVAEPVGI